MKVLVTGAGGQVGREIQETCPQGVELEALDHPRLDITRQDQVRRVFEESRPAWVINAAAYTAVDRAEDEPDIAHAVNADGPGNLAREARRLGARLIHLSTDFVFDGNQNHPYLPEDRTEPQSVYGASKLAGERQVMQICGGDVVVIRTAWVYSRFGTNFVKTMLRLMAERTELSVVADQIGSPTWGRGLARVVWSIPSQSGTRGLFHWTDSGVASWYDLAVAVADEGASLGLLESSCRVQPVPTADHPTAARRPVYSVLDTRRTQDELGMEAVHWRRQLRAMLTDLDRQGED